MPKNFLWPKLFLTFKFVFGQTHSIAWVSIVYNITLHYITITKDTEMGDEVALAIPIVTQDT